MIVFGQALMVPIMHDGDPTPYLNPDGVVWFTSFFIIDGVAYSSYNDM